MSASMQLVITARDDAQAALSQVRKELHSMGTNLDGISKTAQTTGRHLDGIGKSSMGAVGGVKGLVDGLGKIGLAAMGISAVAQSIKGLGSTLGIGLQMELEDVRAQFMAFYKDAGKVDKVLAELRVEANKTPFAFSEIAKAAAGLGPAAKQANMPLMDLIRDAEILAASNPAQGLEGAAFALREAVSGDFTSIIERFNLPRSYINQLRKEGVPDIEIVRRAMKQMGYDMDLVSAKSKTLAGRWSTFLDAIDTRRMQISQPIFEAIGEALDWISQLLNDNEEAVTAFANSIADGFRSAIQTVKNLGRGFLDILGYLGEGNKRDLMREWFGDLGPRVDEVVRFIKKIPTELGLVVAGAQNAFAGMRRAFELGSWGGVAKFIGDALAVEWGKINWGSVWTTITVTAETVGKWLAGAGTAILDFLRNLWPTAEQWASVWTTITITADTVGKWLSGAGTAVLGFLQSLWPTAEQWASVWKAITVTSLTVGEWLGNAGNAVVAFLQSLWPTAEQWAGVWKAISLTATDVGNWFAGGADAVLDWLRKIWPTAEQWAKVWGDAKVTLDTVTLTVGKALIDARDAVVTTTAPTPLALAEWFQQAQKDMTAWLGTIQEWGAGLGKALWDAIKAAFAPRSEGQIQGELLNPLWAPIAAALKLALDATLGTVLMGVSGIIKGFFTAAYEELRPALESVFKTISDAVTLASQNNSLAVNDIQIAWHNMRTSIERDAAAIRTAMSGIGTGNPQTFRLQPEGSVPGRAAGGPVRPGMPYLVGEKGKELFVPKTAGAILPAGSFGMAADGAGSLRFQPMDSLGTDVWASLQSIITAIVPSLAQFKAALDSATSSLGRSLAPSATGSATALTALTTAASANPAALRVGQTPEGYLPPAWTPAPTTDPRLADAIERISAGDQIGAAVGRALSGLKVTVTMPNGQTADGVLSAARSQGFA